MLFKMGSCGWMIFFSTGPPCFLTANEHNKRYFPSHIVFLHIVHKCPNWGSLWQACIIQTSSGTAAVSCFSLKQIPIIATASGSSLGSKFANHQVESFVWLHASFWFGLCNIDVQQKHFKWDFTFLFIQLLALCQIVKHDLISLFMGLKNWMQTHTDGHEDKAK